jgi:cupin 2 domain-containing protein
MTNIIKSNIYENIPTTSNKELFEIIAQNDKIRIERIVSFGQCSPEGFFYDQDEDEFVILLEGSATVSFEDGTIHDLKRGDYLNIPAHVKHRVDFTENTTVWLAVFYM